VGAELLVNASGHELTLGYGAKPWSVRLIHPLFPVRESLAVARRLIRTTGRFISLMEIVIVGAAMITSRLGYPESESAGVAGNNEVVVRLPGQAR
jgi:hypothetical protein